MPLPPSIGPAPPPLPVQAAPVIAVVPQLTAEQRAALVQLANAQQALEAMITSLPATRASLMTVETPVGQLQIKLPTLALQKADTLLLQIVNPNATSPTLKLVAVNGQSPPALGQPGLPAGLPTGAPQTGASPLATPQPMLDKLPLPQSGPVGIPATIVHAAQTSLPGQTPLPAGTALVVRLLGLQSGPAATAAPQTPSVPPVPGTPATAPLPAGPAAAAPQPSAPTAASPASASPVAPPPQTPDAPPPAPPLPTAPPAVPPATGGQPSGQVVTGTVAPNTHLGKPLVQTPLGLLSLDSPTPLPPGSQISLELVGRPTPPSAPPTTTAPTTPLGLPQTLDAAIATLRQTDPVAADRLIARLPQDGLRGAAAMVALGGTLRSGTGRNLIGERTIDSLDRAGRGELARRLVAEFESLAGQTQRPSLDGQWQVSTIPFWTGQDVAPVRVVVRRPQDRDAEQPQSEAGEGLRFLVDVTMSQLGPVQLDGLVRRAAKRFDLIVRTDRALDAEMRQDITAIFAKALDGLNMAGMATFQAGGHFIEVPEEVAPGLSGAVMA